MRKADLINNISEKTGIPKVDVLVTLETMFKEVKENLANGENIYIRGFGSFITKKRAAKIGRNIKKNTAVHIPEHYIPAFKPAKEFVHEVKNCNLRSLWKRILMMRRKIAFNFALKLKAIEKTTMDSNIIRARYTDGPLFFWQDQA